MTIEWGKAPIKAEGELVDPDARPVERDLDAWNDLMEFLEPGETVQALVFGEYGWGGYSEEDLPEGAGVPKDQQGRVLSPSVARPLMKGWSFNGGYGAPECYATYIWTADRVIWVTQYDGSTRLDSAPRHPAACIPDMPGG